MNNDSKIEIKALRQYVEKEEVSKTRHIASLFLIADLAIWTSEWHIDEKIKFINIVDEETAANYVHNLQDVVQREIISKLDSEKIKKIFTNLDSDEAVDILEDLNEETKEILLKTLDDDTRRDIKRILKFNEADAGYHMSLNFVSVNINSTVSQALAEVKKQIKEEDAELAGNIYVIDSEEKLRGRVPIETILISKKTENISEIMEPSPSLLTKDNISKMNEYFEIYGEESIPVTTTSRKLIGIVEPKDILEVLNEYSNTNITHQTSLSGESVKQYKGYMSQNSFQIFKSRIFWIFILLFIGLVTQVIISGFQTIWSSTGEWASGTGRGTVGTMVVTTAFATAISVASSVNDSSGNSGSQSSAVIIEAMAMGEIQEKDASKVLLKEVNVGMWIGSAVAIGSYARTYLVWAMFGQLGDLSGIEHGWMAVTATIASVSFLVAIVFGNFIGAALPILGQKFKWNSAIISGPVSTTLVDIFVFAFYLGLTTAVYVPLVNSGYFDTIGTATQLAGTTDIQSIIQIWII